MTERELLIQQLKGRSEFCRTRGEIKSPELMERAIKLLEVHQGYRLVPTTPTMKVYDRLFAEHDLDEDRVTYIYKDIMDAVGH